MRPLELTLGFLAIISAITFFLPKLPSLWKSRILPAILVLVALAQITLEGFRWQLWPLLIAAVTLIVISQIDTKFRGKVLILVLLILFSFISLAAGYLFPVPDPYPITGPYQVGTREIHVVDPNREEIYGSDPDAPREFMAQVWYPAAPGPTDEHAQWMPAIEFAAPAIAEKLSLPAFALDHLQYVKANAYLEAPLLRDNQGFPVLIFSHGWEGFKEQNIFQVEELASHGYVVIGINHTYGAILTVFPDGRLFPVDHNALPSDVPDEVYDRASNTLVKNDQRIFFESLIPDFLYDPENLINQNWGQAQRRFIQQQQLRSIHQCAAESQHLPFAAAKRACFLGQPLLEHIKQCIHPFIIRA